MDTVLQTVSVAASVIALAIYEIYLSFESRRQPHRVARSVHGEMRARWVRALETHPGSEILAVQTLRNSLMSATILGSTAALALLGSFSVGLPLLAHGVAINVGDARSALLLLLMVSLFGSFLTAALSMRLFNHAGFMLSFPVGSPERAGLSGVAADYLRRAGHHYSRSLHLLLLVGPLLIGIVAPLVMPFATVAWLIALRAYDRAPAMPQVPD
ncbi:MAG: DUF599 domain-containing protein [Pseudomonadota bacterium]|nr:DUF599 domain-containing protein [Pseudomonadota bacterium]